MSLRCPPPRPFIMLWSTHVVGWLTKANGSRQPTGEYESSRVQHRKEWNSKSKHFNKLLSRVLQWVVPQRYHEHYRCSRLR
ncbi:hypothetical protein EG68_10328 [Paragonimus skrjabini miyazakii]|uniref:Uncharacterized protein n=1 Tax=Paragonimus skrjabini miyazakii TaxID=59628 RepID=A0A8S9YQK3_9TREM|nr:hypothetical protein EG68_10328 [Paragonimus skrjabini miyazakii]